MNYLFLNDFRFVRFAYSLSIIFFCFSTQVFAEELTIAVANSTCSTIKKVGQIYAEKQGHSINFICKSSGRLAKGLKGGAISADIYLSANRSWMDFMIKNDLVLKQNIISPWGNKLVVAVNEHSSLDIIDLSELATEKVKTILIGDPSTAPFGRYAKETLQKKQLWEKVKAKIITKKHITILAETLAKEGNSTIGILFFSNVNKKHRVIYSIDNSWHSEIRYYLAPLKAASNFNLVLDFFNFLQTPLSQKIFSDAGFDVNTD